MAAGAGALAVTALSGRVSGGNIEGGVLMLIRQGETR